MTATTPTRTSTRPRIVDGGGGTRSPSLFRISLPPDAPAELVALLAPLAELDKRRQAAREAYDRLRLGERAALAADRASHTAAIASAARAGKATPAPSHAAEVAWRAELADAEATSLALGDAVRQEEDRVSVEVDLYGSQWRQELNMAKKVEAVTAAEAALHATEAIRAQATLVARWLRNPWQRPRL
jgi:hypothetical protein